MTAALGGRGMSRFIDKLKQTSKMVPQPMGFKLASSVIAKPVIQIVARLAEADVASLADCVAGADAGLLPLVKSSQGVKAFSKATQDVSGIPWGVLGYAGVKSLESAVKAGCDFIVFPASGALLPVVRNEKVGRILQVEVSLDGSLLRAVNGLPIDAVLINGEKKGSLTWQNLMQFQYFADTLTKPLLAAVPPTLTVDEIEALWAVGVDALVVEVGAGQPVGRINELRKAVDGLTFPPRSRRGKGEALLPVMGTEMEAVSEEEEE